MTTSEFDVRPLLDAVVGPVLLPHDEAFAAECAGFNLLVVHDPAVIVGASSAADVQAAVRFAVDRGLPVAVLATGHQPFPPATGSVLVVGGLSPTMGRTHGWAADHVRALDVVTADGELRCVTRSSDPDLFWAVRGGKSNFGVVTAIEIALFPVTEYFGGGIFYAGEHTAAVLHAYREWIADAPDELNSSIGLLTELSVEGVDKVVELAGPASDCRVVILDIRHLGGALGRPAASPNALDVRDARISVWGAAVGDPVEVEAVLAQLRELVDELGPWSTGRKYLNFMSGDDAVEHAFGDENLRRLRTVKSRYDPANVFRSNNHNVLPNA